MSGTARLLVNKPGEGRTIAVVGDVYRFLATGEDTSGKQFEMHNVLFVGSKLQLVQQMLQTREVVGGT